jgi:hypothetical protein
VSTRKLILLALACGLAILVAGSVQLLRIRNGGSSTLEIGDSTELATVTARVSSATVENESFRVAVRLGVAATATSALQDSVSGWTLLAAGLKKPVAAEGAGAGSLRSCAGLAVSPGDSIDCLLVFPVATGDRESAYVTFTFAGRSATWRLDV